MWNIESRWLYITRDVKYRVEMHSQLKSQNELAIVDMWILESKWQNFKYTRDTKYKVEIDSILEMRIKESKWRDL